MGGETSDGSTKGATAPAAPAYTYQRLLHDLPTSWFGGHTADVPSHYEVFRLASSKLASASDELASHAFAAAQRTEDGANGNEDAAARDAADAEAAELALLARETAELARVLAAARSIPLYKLGLIRAIASHLASTALGELRSTKSLRSLAYLVLLARREHEPARHPRHSLFVCAAVVRDMHESWAPRDCRLALALRSYVREQTLPIADDFSRLLFRLGATLCLAGVIERTHRLAALAIPAARVIYLSLRMPAITSSTDAHLATMVELLELAIVVFLLAGYVREPHGCARGCALLALVAGSALVVASFWIESIHERVVELYRLTRPLVEALQAVSEMEAAALEVLSHES